jgi:hypothetical protein
MHPDYAWGKDNGDVFRAAIKKLKLDVGIVYEAYPKLFAEDYS